MPEPHSKAITHGDPVPADLKSAVKKKVRPMKPGDL